MCLSLTLHSDSFRRELDHAMLRRLEKRILVDLPSLEAREAMLKQYLPPSIHSGEGSVEIKTEIDYGELAKVTMQPSHENILMITLSVYSFSSIRHLLPMRGISPLCPLGKGEGRGERGEGEVRTGLGHILETSMICRRFPRSVDHLRYQRRCLH